MSRLTDGYFREGRMEGLTRDQAVLRVWLTGWVHATNLDPMDCEVGIEDAMDIYRLNIALGHEGALDEVFLAGHAIGARGHLARLTGGDEANLLGWTP